MATDEASHINELVNKLIPEGRRALQDSYRNLAELGDYCEQSYFNAEDESAKKAALDESKQYAVQSLASVAYQVNAMAARTLELFNMHTSQLSTLESTIHHISQTIDIHKEKVARREIGSLAANKRNTRVHKITMPAREDRGVRYMRINYNMSALDTTGHGVILPEADEFPYKKRAQAVVSDQDAQLPPAPGLNRLRNDSVRSLQPNSRFQQPSRAPGAPDVSAPVAPTVPGFNRSFDYYDQDLPAPAPPTIPSTYSGRAVQAPEPVQYDQYDPPPAPMPPMPPGGMSAQQPGSGFGGGRSYATPPEPHHPGAPPPPPPAAPGAPPPPPEAPGAPPPPPMNAPGAPPPPPMNAPGSLSPPALGGGGSLADQLRARSGELSPPTVRDADAPAPQPSVDFQDQLAKAVKQPQGRKKAMVNQRSMPAAQPPPTTPPPRPPSPPDNPAPPPPGTLENTAPPLSMEPPRQGPREEPDSAVDASSSLPVKEAGPLDPPWAPREFIEKAVTIYPYEKDRVDELTFEEGELIYVVKKNADDWFEGIKDPGERGLFPGNYVQTLYP